MKTHGIDIQKDGVTITKLSTDETIASADDETLLTSLASKTYVDDKFKSGCFVYRTDAQSIPDAGNPNKIQFNIVDYDHLNEYDENTNYRFTATEAGIYLVSSGVQMVTLEDGSRIISYVYKNEATYALGMDFTMGKATVVATHVCVPVKMAATDYVDIRIYQDSAGAKNTYSDYVWMIVQRVA